MTAVQFEATPYKIHNWTILRLPVDVSKQLPSRGIVMVKGTINDSPFEAVLEPDGWGSHWINLDKKLRGTTGVDVGDAATVEIEPTKDWIEPEVPTDITTALNANPAANETWQKVTPQAHWEWIRWIRATNNTETRSRRIEVACSKLKSGMRRPCCFNASACTVAEISKNGALLDPEPAIL
jgi:hypothetical protein